jgi:hypothetical protein
MLLFIFVPFFLIISFFFHKKKGLGQSILHALLVTSILIVFSTEYLSYFHLFNKKGLMFFWSALTGILLSKHINKKYDFFYVLKYTIKNIKSLFEEISSLQKGVLLSLLFILCLIIIQGIAYPPNNWDSMTYHLPRITHWIQNNSIENYPTNITRQIYSPPFSEYAIAQTSILCSGDTFNNLVQLIYLLGTCIVVIEITKLFSANKNIILLGFCLSFTLPEAVLQASSTQNDLVHSFFLLSALFHSIHFFKRQNFESAIWIGITIGLALLSKIIAFFYVPALLLIIALFALIKSIRTKNKRPILFLIISGFIILVINLNFTLRKLDFTNNLSGTSEKIEDGITLKKYGVKLLLSTCIKNIALHADPLFVGDFGNIFAEKTHLIIGQNLNEKGTNVFDTKFNAVSFWSNHEDSQPNMIITILFFFCIILLSLNILFKKTKLFSLESGLLILITFQFLTLNLIIRWEPWNSRIHTPIFFEIIVFCCLILSKQIKIKQYFYHILISFSIGYAIFISICNHTRPIFCSTKYAHKINITDSRYKKYFMNQPEMFPEFEKFYSILCSQKQKTNVGYISHIDGWEYPITSVIFHNNNINIDHIRITNSSSKYTKDFAYKYIFSSFMNQDTIKFKKEVFENISPDNKFIFCYKKTQQK